MKKTAVLVLLGATTLFTNAARAEDTNVNLLINQYNKIGIATLQTGLTMSNCKVLAGKFLGNFNTSSFICISKDGKIETLREARVLNKNGTFKSKAKWIEMGTAPTLK